MPTISEIMTPDPVTVRPSATLVDAARCMRDEDIGDVIVLDEADQVRGILTDRDIVVRCLADGADPTTAQVADVCSGDVITAAPGDEVADVVTRMRDHAVRRLPVVEGGRPVGIVSIGDLAVERDPDSALADISSAPPSP